MISVSGRFRSVNRKIWEMIDRINRHGHYDLPGASEEAVRKSRKQINDVLQSVGLKYRIVSSGTVLKPEFVDLVAGI